MRTLLSALRCLLVMCMAAATHFGFQCPDGTPGPCGKPKPTPTPTPRPPAAPPRSSPSPPPAPPPCYEAALLVNCAAPGCLVSLNGAQRQTRADQDGKARFPDLAKGKYTITASKAGYDYAASTVQLDCGDNKSVELKPLLRAVTLRIRTAPPQCEILIDRQAKGRSDAQGVFNFQAASLSLMIEARKDGFLSATKGVQLEPGKPEQEILLALDPIPALLTIVAALDSAQVRVDQQPERRAINEE
ncbi:MAG: carboxypeptidase-like regulatory domain-containing protein, partial [Blastocatellia bacterium]